MKFYVDISTGKFENTPFRWLSSRSESVLRFCLNTLGYLDQIEGLSLRLWSHSLSAADAFDIADVVACLENNGSRVTAFCENLSLTNFTAISSAAERVAPPLSGPIVPAFSWGHLDVREALWKLGIEPTVFCDQYEKHVSLNFDNAEQVAETRQTLVEHIVSKLISQASTNVGFSISNLVSDGIPTGAHAEEQKLLTNTGYGDEISDTSHKTLVRESSIVSKLLPWNKAHYDVFALRSNNFFCNIDELCSYLIRAKKSKRPLLILIDFDGGDLDSAIRLSAILKRARKRRRIYGYIQKATSAGLILSSSVDECIANPVSILGGAGAATFRLDFDGLSKRSGIRWHAPLSGDAINFKMAEQKSRFGGQLFADRLAALRPSCASHLDKIMTGRLFNSEQAVQMGLIDRVGTLSQCLRSLELMKRRANLTARIGGRSYLDILKMVIARIAK